MSKLLHLNLFFSAFNNAVAVKKKTFYIRNTLQNYKLIQILYKKNYFQKYVIVSKQQILVYLNTNLKTATRYFLVNLSKPSKSLFVTCEFLQYFLTHCQVVKYSILINTVLGIFFLEDAIKLKHGGLLICYLKQN